MTIIIVKKGDSLWEIATKNKVDPSKIIEVNGLESTALVPGLALYIPDEKAVNRRYLIKSQDTLTRIGSRFGTSAAAIMEANPGIVANSLIVGTELLIPSSYKNQLITLGFAFPTSGGVVFETLEENGDKLSYLAIVAYSFTREGNAYVDGDDLPLIAKCEQTGVKPLLMIRNFQDGDFDADLAGDVLASSVYRANLINSMLNFVKEKGYGGVSMDIEFIPPARRSDYVLFLKELKEGLNELILHVNVHAKTADNPDNRIVGGHDYRGIGEAADLVAVMTIDYGYPTGPPEPISPLWWMGEVLRYALSNIPVNKLQSAFPLYGYDWIVPSHETKALSAQNAQNLAIATGAEITFDTSAASPTYSYRIENSNHVVWFEDIRSISAKYEMIDAYELIGATYWQIGLEFPQNWGFIDKNIWVIK
ncbi:LysM peptidoglycan-binding domain-containing protein [Peribacillus simplex]|uniref:Chitinase n=2 Tax=Peribacillus simplex TaxID=1478 RepID=A0A223ENK5_9BACI|nr:LysM peptidoglycan-binding domain-containing protein [Peribacillus simplex]ASS96774.1 chitinase [Peribacillus simplex NBRC 15720 = DSM 1321]MEC1395810.1 LysM peptidoglycan-binding domain-containing protein [Peribacillus simplex]TVX84051.1 LysM peptidoglycan-binding domain-containing protein [Peribacillus simplex]